MGIGSLEAFAGLFEDLFAATAAGDTPENQNVFQGVEVAPVGE